MFKNVRWPWAYAVVFCVITVAAGVPARTEQSDKVMLRRVPNGGIQPQVSVDDQGTIHMVYFKGEPRQGDVFYVRSADQGMTFSTPVRVNSQEGSAVAAGSIRGAHIAVGEGHRVHVAWNGSSIAEPRGAKDPEQPKGSPHNGVPMLYARTNDAGTGFELQRNLMQRTFGLDGGGSVAADDYGNVYVAWHGKAEGAEKGEAGRSVWLARSHDRGETFFPESTAFEKPTGTCGCCGMRIFADHEGAVYVLFRSATQDVNRDIHLLISQDQGRSFEGTLVDRWKISACPMSSMAFAEAAGTVVAAWETAGQVFYAAIGSAQREAVKPTGAPGIAKGRKHPAVAHNKNGEIIMVWTEGTAWGKGGSLGWQVFDKNGHPTANKGLVDDLPVWSFGAVFSRADGGFTILY